MRYSRYKILIYIIAILFVFHTNCSNDPGNIPLFLAAPNSGDKIHIIHPHANPEDNVVISGYTTYYIDKDGNGSDMTMQTNWQTNLPFTIGGDGSLHITDSEDPLNGTIVGTVDGMTDTFHISGYYGVFLDFVTNADPNDTSTSCPVGVSTSIYFKDNQDATFTWTDYSFQWNPYTAIGYCDSTDSICNPLKIVIPGHKLSNDQIILDDATIFMDFSANTFSGSVIIEGTPAWVGVNNPPCRGIYSISGFIIE
ncbi:hypothetical protein [Leptospira neocaledonica]|uniref:Uncharacterized protein n=1 Tax=Leptospira neocaledonica TaxID=2023192 RepID=A0A2M9ZYZ2_9LEPT|nr:hypothetical protein [Leptospira neocaledonica]PJZ77302.1 hypothetical protein CH365_11235 [Leptospira neocaledonica]